VALDYSSHHHPITPTIRHLFWITTRPLQLARLELTETEINNKMADHLCHRPCSLQMAY
jgi:hypothetical protein